MVVAFFIGGVALPARAQDAPLPPVTVGGGLQTSFVHDEPDEADGTDAFKLNSARLYINGSATKNVKFMFNTEYNGASNDIGVLDAVAMIEFSPKFNVWFGRFLPPSDRANLYGPYYAHHWSVFTDGVQDGYPFIFQGRDNGAMYWGQFGMVKVSGGVFDGESATGDDTVISAGRVQVDFWDPEGGYYLNGTYYGEKDLLAIGVAAQTADAGDAYSVDFLLEKKLGNSGVITVESEYAMYDGLGGYGTPVGGGYEKQDGWYLLGAYLFPGSDKGKFQVLAKYGQANFDFGPADLDQDTLEVDLNYLIKTFNARISLYYLDKSFDPDVGGDSQTVGVGLQIQM